MSFFAKLAHQISANAEAAPPRTFSVAVARVGDVGELAESIRGYQIEFMQLDRGPFVAELVQTRLSGVLLTAAQYGRSLAHSGGPPSRTVTFGIGTTRLPAVWQGREFEPHDLLVGTSATEIDLVSQPAFGVATASFPLELVEATADSLGLGSVAPGSTRLIRCLEDKAHLIRGTFGAVFNEAASRPYAERAAVRAASKQEDLLRILLGCIRDPAAKTKSGSSPERARVLKAALAAIKNRPEDTLSVGELCRIAKASERTLHYAFMERFGLPPAHYMKALRLNGARRDLRGDREPSVKIADIANKWGFWHLGQFAKDYRQWFSELPSDTYQRKHGTDARRLR
jgi:AraC family ethanolamine operon transcriptional activator